MTSQHDAVAILAERVRALAARRERVIIGIAGSPGSGKTTLAGLLVERLGADAVAVPMDGFHLADAELARLGRADRKGAIDTFDGAGVAALLRRIRDDLGEIVYAPAFDRAIGEPVAGSIPVEPRHRIVVVEGNYLLVPDGPWSRVGEQLDERWFAVAPAELRLRRLVERHVRHGRTRAAAEAWARDVDGANAVLIEATQGRADLLVSGVDSTIVGG